MGYASTPAQIEATLTSLTALVTTATADAATASADAVTSTDSPTIAATAAVVADVAAIAAAVKAQTAQSLVFLRSFPKIADVLSTIASAGPWTLQAILQGKSQCPLCSQTAAHKSDGSCYAV